MKLDGGLSQKEGNGDKMSKKTGISWTDSTWNPWWGCAKVSPGCAHCYAERDSLRFEKVSLWGNSAPRKLFGNAHWNDPETWNSAAGKKQEQRTVFCGSMCDVFENRDCLRLERERLWTLIEKTPNLIWLLLTKRPENIAKLSPADWMHRGFPENVWLGVSVESNEYLDRIDWLRFLAVKKFLSIEPLLGDVDLDIKLPCSPVRYRELVDWVIIGGESGLHHREMDLCAAENIINDCRLNSIPVFVKQLGGHPDKRDRLEEFPEALRVQEFPVWRNGYEEKADF